MTAAARFAAAPIGPGLAATDGGLTLTTTAAALSIARAARSDVAQSAGTHGVEFALWGDADLVAAVGVVQTSAALTAQVGSAGGIGWRLDTGEIHAAGAVVASGLPIIGKGTIVGVLVDLDAGTITFYSAATLVHTRAIGAGPWHYAASIAAAEAATLVCAVSADQRQAISPAGAAGWRAPAPSIDTVLLSDIDWLSGTGDTPATARYEGLIDSTGMVTADALAFWPWGGTMPTQSGVAQCRVLDPDGLLDALALADASGVAVAVRSADSDGTLATSTPVARYVLDRVEIEDDGHKQIYFTDPHADLDEPITRGVFLPSIPALAWQPQPVVIGAVASVPVLLANTDGSVGFIADSPLAEVSVVLDRGDVMEPGTWTLDPSSQQLLLDQPPVGPVVVDASSIGAGMAPATLKQALTAIFSRINKSAWSSADAQAIDTATGYAGIGFYADGGSVRDALAAILPSYGAWWYKDTDGVLRFARVIDPDAGSLDFELDTSDQVTDVRVTPDLAPKLSRRMAYRPNARILGAGDLVTDLVDVPLWRRQELTAPWRGLAYASGPLAARYVGADTAPPMVSCFWRAQDAQAEASRVVALYAIERRFYTWRVAGNRAIALKPGQTGRITYPRYGLDAGRRVLVRSVERNPVTGDSTIDFWGA